MVVDALDQGVLEAGLDAQLAPRVLLGGVGAFGLRRGEARGGLGQALGGVGAAAEDEVLDELAELRVDLGVDLEHAGVDDGHVEPRLDGVIQEDRVDGLADLVVALEGERDVGQAARGARAGAAALDLRDGLDEVERVAVMLRHAGADRQDVRVEDDVLRVDADLLREDAERAFADADLVGERGGLADLVEGHDDHRGAVAAAEAGLPDEVLLAVLERDRVHDGLALHAAQAGLDDAELRRVDHERDLGDVRFGRRHVQELRHRRGAVEQGHVEIDVDDRGAGLDLLLGDAQGGAVVVLLDVALEDLGAGDVGALAHVHEGAGAADDVQRLEPGEPERGADLAGDAGRVFLGAAADGGDMAGRGAAAAAEDVDQAVAGEGLEDGGGVFGAFGEARRRERVRQAGVRIARDVDVGLLRELGDVRAHLLAAEGAVHADADRLGVADGVPEGFGRLPGERAAGGVGDRARDHHRQAEATGFEGLVDGEEGGLEDERVEDRLAEEEVGAGVDEGVDLLAVGVAHLEERHVALGGVVDVAGHRQRLVRRPDGAGDEGVLARVGGLEGVDGLAGDLDRLGVQLADEVRHRVVFHRDGRAVEGVGLEDVGAGVEVGAVDVADDGGLGDDEQVVVALELSGVVLETVAAVVLLLQFELLDHGAHRAVEVDDALAQEGLEALAGRVQRESLTGHRPYPAGCRPRVKAGGGPIVSSRAGPASCSAGGPGCGRGRCVCPRISRRPRAEGGVRS